MRQASAAPYEPHADVLNNNIYICMYMYICIHLAVNTILNQ